MTKFFISYASEDARSAKYIHSFLSKTFKGCGTFFLSAFIPPSTEWKKRIKLELDSAAAGLFLLTPRSIDKKWVSMELGSLYFADKPVFPLLAGGLAIDDLDDPLRDVQAALLDDVESVDGLLQQLAALCGGPVGNTRTQIFCRHIPLLSTPATALRSLQKVMDTLELTMPLEPIMLSRSQLVVEARVLTCSLVRSDTIQISGKVKDAGSLIIKLPPVPDAAFLLIETHHTHRMRCAFEEMLKVVVNHDPLVPYLFEQRHWRDKEFVAREDGIFVYSLRESNTDEAFDVKVVFWRAEMERLQLRFYLAIGGQKMDDNRLLPVLTEAVR